LGTARNQSKALKRPALTLAFFLAYAAHINSEVSHPNDLRTRTGRRAATVPRHACDRIVLDAGLDEIDRQGALTA